MRKSVVALGLVVVFLGWSFFWWISFYAISWIFLIIGSSVSIVGVWLKSPREKIKEVFVPVTPVLKIEKCPSCGLSIEEEGVSFCPHCGAELK